MTDALNILSQYQNEFISIASEVGIDGGKLLSRLPAPGTLMKGRSVPVLEKKYQNTCSVLFYINRLDNGQEYPWIRFHTFKHGGITSTFNGARYLIRTTNLPQPTSNQRFHQPRILQSTTPCSQQEEDSNKLARYHDIQKAYFRGTPLSMQHPWLSRRLNGYATSKLITRTTIRVAQNGDVLAPLQNLQHGTVGHHKIFSVNEKDHKRHFVLRSGLLNGSYIYIKGYQENHSTVAICEGLITALTIALVWNGPIYVALTAGNLCHVRQALHDQNPIIRAVIFADNDQWKPHISNVGIKHAQAAKQKGDLVIAPVFSVKSLQHKPTDFNDVLINEGLAQLEQQIRAATNLSSH